MFARKDNYLLVMQSNKPTNHMRIVSAGMSGSSTFDTDARTSGYGESSSSIASKSNSILDKEGVVSITVRVRLFTSEIMEGDGMLGS